MASEPLALARPQQATAPDHYEAFYELLSASARGRAFLAEHARRGRAADTEILLAALARIEALVRANTVAQASAARSELQMLVMIIRSTRPQIEAAGMPERAAKLAALVDLLEERIAALAGPLPAMLDVAAADARPRLAVVPPPEQPELPIPSPATNAPPSLVAEPAPPAAQWHQPAVEPRLPPRTERPIPEAIAAAMDQRLTEPEAKAPVAAPDDTKLWALSDAKLVPPPADPLAAIMMLSEDERLALFT